MARDNDLNKKSRELAAAIQDLNELTVTLMQYSLDIQELAERLDPKESE